MRLWRGMKTTSLIIAVFCGAVLATLIFFTQNSDLRKIENLTSTNGDVDNARAFFPVSIPHLLLNGSKLSFKPKLEPRCPIDNSLSSYFGRKKLTEKWDQNFTLSWYRCPVCGHAFVWPQLSEKNLSDIYSTSYSNQAKVQSVTRRAKSQTNWILSSNPLSTMKDLVVLEQGCAHGGLLREFENKSSRLICLEPDPDMKSELVVFGRKKLELIRSLNVDDRMVADSSVDVWLGSHVIEHAPDPWVFVSAASQKLKTGGLFFQEFPNGGRGDQIVNDMPGHFHLNFFSTRSIHVLMTTQGFCHLGTSHMLNKTADTWQDLSAKVVGGPLDQSLRLRRTIIRVLYYKCH